MDDTILLFLEKILEAVYFSMFLLIGKNIKEKRILFTLVMIFEYLMLKHFIKYSVYFQLMYTFISYVNLKVFYKDKAQITDIFLFATGSLILIFISGCFAILAYYFIKNYYICLILSRIILFAILFKKPKAVKDKYKDFCSLWNRHNKPKKIKSLTLRNISIIIFNLMFWLINFGMIICISTYKL